MESRDLYHFPCNGGTNENDLNEGSLKMEVTKELESD